MTRALRILTALVTILFLAGSSITPAAATPVAPDRSEKTSASAATARVTHPSEATQAGYVLLRNGNSGKCLTVRGHAANTQAVQYSCTGLRDQYWSIPAPGTPAQIRNLNSNQCLVARGYSNNAPVVQTPCNSGFADQIWFIVHMNNNRFKFSNYNSWKMLLVRGHGQNAPAVQYTSLDYPDQEWF